MATAGENERIIRDRVWSLFPEYVPSGEAERPIREVDRESLPFGELVLEKPCEVRLARAIEAAGLDPRRGRLVVDV